MENNKTFSTSGHAVVTLTNEKYKYLNIYVRDIRPLVSPKDNTVFVTWNGRSIASGAIGRQISSIWQKLGITESTDKNISSDIIRNNATTGIREKHDPQTAETADLIAHFRENCCYSLLRKKKDN